MSQLPVITDLDVEAYFDLEDFMNFCKETRIENDVLAELNRLWEEWGAMARVRQITQGKNSWLAVWLPQEVEEAVDGAWAESPGKGYLLNALAQYICMVAIQCLLPQVANGGCAPAPARDLKLKAGLQEAGLLEEEDETIPRRYAVVTYYPFRGGCEVCDMRENCPKGADRQNFATVVLPGYEK